MEERTIVNTMGTSAPEVANEKSRLFGSFCKADNALCYRLGAERLFITPWGENSFRVTSTKCAAMPEERWALTEEVKRHNNFAQRIPVIENQIQNLDSRVSKLEVEHGKD